MKIKKIKQLVGMLMMLSCLLSCAKTETEYSSQRIYFVFENNLHNNACLAEVMTPTAGIFCIATLKRVDGREQYSFKNNFGKEELSPLTALDQQRTHILGMNNGLILGYNPLNDPPEFYAFDKECPNCFDYNVIPLKSYPLTINEQAIAVCQHCHREYSLRTGGNIVKGEQGKKLVRYRATTTGAYGVLSVH